MPPKISSITSFAKVQCCPMKSPRMQVWIRAKPLPPHPVVASDCHKGQFFKPAMGPNLWAKLTNPLPDGVVVRVTEPIQIFVNM